MLFSERFQVMALIRQWLRWVALEETKLLTVTEDEAK